MVAEREVSTLLRRSDSRSSRKFEEVRIRLFFVVASIYYTAAYEIFPKCREHNHMYKMCFPSNSRNRIKINQSCVLINP